ncbi:sigma-70 family RNA polymerase sigma factor [Terrabacter sp. C0L_2]|uniref:sigma-70 family RNA polymerase sigma factor n=1 Tax=Terrabacter sp. C0L_2 TaxID=3108389 RepID=UPI002ED4FFE8|nr:sigma-70 family RNA polymerase sigma factor [Terrabacter sp. C0L_2]
MSADATLWSSEAWASAPDAYLLLRTREGSAEAFGELWRRHLPAAYAVAGRHRGRSAPEDIVAEAAARVLALIRDGRGPDEHFRAYFLSAVRTVAIDQGRRDLRVVPAEPEDLEELAEPHEDPLAVLAADDEGLALVREAFAGLSERDQRVLWHTTVEGAAPRTVAPAMGMTANAVSARAMRARESLRALYLDACAQRGLADADSEECRWTVEHLGALVRGRLPKRQTERAEAHVAGCPHAAAIADDLRLVHDGFPALLVPLVLAAGLGTPGFVGVAALLGLSGGAGAAGVAGSASATGSGPVAGGAVGTPGPVTGSAGSSAPSGASGAGSVAEVASQVTALVAGLAVTAGVAGALALPAPSLARPSAAPVPAATTTVPAPSVTSGPGGVTAGLPGTAPGSTGQPSGALETVSASAIPSAVGLTGTPSPELVTDPSAGAKQPDTSSAGQAGAAGSGATPSSTSTRPTVPPAPASTPEPGPPTTRSVPTLPPAPPPTLPPAPPPTVPPPPTTVPPTTPPPQPGPAAPSVTVRLVAAGDPSRISVRVRTQTTGVLTMRISNVSGSGALTVRNSSWSCAQASPASVRCTGGRGQALLEQSVTGGVEPIVVRITDAAGNTWTETLRPT